MTSINIYNALLEEGIQTLSTTAEDFALVTKDPTGFEDGDNIVANYDHTTRTVTLTHVSGVIAWRWRGARYTVNSPWTSTAHTATAPATWFLKFQGDVTTENWSTIPWTFNDVMVSAVVYRATADQTFALRESHGLMPALVHEELHATIGTYWTAGTLLDPSTYLVNGTTDANNTFGIDAGAVKDEDLRTNIAAWPEGTYTIAYRSGLTDWVFTTGNTLPFIVAANTIQRNLVTGSSWSLTPALEDTFMNYYDFAIPVASDANSQQFRHVLIMGQAVYVSLAAAQAEFPQNLDLGSLSNIAAEFVCVNRITFSFNASGVNSKTTTGRCSIQGVTPIRGSRANQVALAAAAPADHGSLTGLSNDDHTQYALVAGRAANSVTVSSNFTADLSASSYYASGGDIVAALPSPAGALGKRFIFACGNARMTLQSPSGIEVTSSYVVQPFCTVEVEASASNEWRVINERKLIRMARPNTLAVGQAVKIVAGADPVVLAQADSEANAAVVGIVEYRDSGNVLVNTGSIATNLTGLTDGVQYYLSPTVAGGLTTVKPTVRGQIVKAVMVATSSTTALVNIGSSTVVGEAVPPVQVALANNAATNIIDLAASDGAVLNGVLYVNGTADYRATIRADVSKKATDGTFVISPSIVTGDTDPGISIDITSAGVVQVTLPSIVGFVAATFDYTIGQPTVVVVSGGGGGVTDHGFLTGLGDDDHTQYELVGGRNGTLNADILAEKTAAAGVTVDGVLLKDGSAQNAGFYGTEPAAVSSSSSGTAGVATTASRSDHGHDLGVHGHTGPTDGGLITAGVTDHGALTGLADDDHTQYELVGGRNGTLNADIIAEKTAAAGVTVDGVLLKDGSAQNVGFYGAEPGVVSTSFSGSEGVANTASRSDHNHDLGVHGHTSGTDGGFLAPVITDHGLLDGLADDDHTQYELVGGRNGTLNADVIAEKTATAGVTVDGVLLKDGSAQNVGFYGSEPAAVSSSTSGTAGVATTASRSDHGHDLGAHGHTSAADGGYIAPVITDHGALTGLGDDDHAQYELVGGRNGTLNADVIAEKTATAGVTVDGVLLKDGSAQNVGFYGSEPAAVSSSTSGTAGVAVTASRSDHGHDLGVHGHTSAADGGLITGGATDHGALTGLADDDHTQYELVGGRNGTLNADILAEKTAAAGVTVDGVLLKDGSAQNAGFYGGEPGPVGSGTSGQAGTATTASRSDHSHDLGAHGHTSAADGGLIVMGGGGSFHGCRYTSNRGQVVASGGIPIMDYEDVDYDTTGNVVTGANWRFTATLAGYYQVSARVWFQLSNQWSAGEQAEIAIQKNGVMYSEQLTKYIDSGADQIMPLLVTDTVYLAVGDYIHAIVYQSSGVNLTTTLSGTNNSISITKIG